LVGQPKVDGDGRKSASSEVPAERSAGTSEVVVASGGGGASDMKPRGSRMFGPLASTSENGSQEPQTAVTGHIRRAAETMTGIGLPERSMSLPAGA
jgi:hypothetical protein